MTLSESRLGQDARKGREDLVKGKRVRRILKAILADQRRSRRDQQAHWLARAEPTPSAHTFGTLIVPRGRRGDNPGSHAAREREYHDGPVCSGSDARKT